MSEPSSLHKSHEMYGLPGLERFIERLQPGMVLEGRIVDSLGENIFILRVWGNNILTESRYRFQKFDEVVLNVRSVQPTLVFSIRPADTKQGAAIYA